MIRLVTRCVCIMPLFVSCSFGDGTSASSSEAATIVTPFCKIRNVPFLVSKVSTTEPELFNMDGNGIELGEGAPGLVVDTDFGSVTIETTKGSLQDPQQLDSVTLGLDWIPVLSGDQFGTLESLGSASLVGWGAIIYIEEDDAIRAFTWGASLDGSVMDLGGTPDEDGQVVNIWSDASSGGDQLDAIDYTGWMFSTDLYSSCYSPPPGSEIFNEILYCDVNSMTQISVKYIADVGTTTAVPSSKVVFSGLSFSTPTTEKFKDAHFTSLAYDREHEILLFSVVGPHLSPDDQLGFFVMKLKEDRSGEPKNQLQHLNPVGEPVRLRMPNGRLLKTSTRPKGVCGVDPRSFIRSHAVADTRKK